MRVKIIDLICLLDEIHQYRDTVSNEEVERMMKKCRPIGTNKQALKSPVEKKRNKY